MMMVKPWEPLQLKVVVTQAAEHCLLEEIMRERDLLHGLMNNIPDLIWFKDGNGRFTRVNRSALRFFGASDPSLLIRKSASDFFRADEAGEIEAEEQTIRLQRTATSRIHKLHSSDGAIRWMSTTKAPILERNGDLAAVVGVSRDVTQQKQAELALHESEERYRQIVETTVEGVWILNEHLYGPFCQPQNGPHARLQRRRNGRAGNRRLPHRRGPEIADRAVPAAPPRREHSLDRGFAAEKKGWRRALGDRRQQPDAGFVGTAHRHALHVHGHYGAESTRRAIQTGAEAGSRGPLRGRRGARFQ